MQIARSRPMESVPEEQKHLNYINKKYSDIIGRVKNIACLSVSRKNGATSVCNYKKYVYGYLVIRSDVPNTEN